METITTASLYPSLQLCAAELGKEIKRMAGIVQHLAQFAQKGEIDRYLADATVFMEMAGYVVIGWQWLKQAETAAKKLAEKDFTNNSEAFYQSKIHTMEFFFRYELPHAAACEKTLLQDGNLTGIRNMDMFA